MSNSDSHNSTAVEDIIAGIQQSNDLREPATEETDLNKIDLSMLANDQKLIGSDNNQGDVPQQPVDENSDDEDDDSMTGLTDTTVVSHVAKMDAVKPCADDPIRKIQLLRLFAEYEKQGFVLSKKYNIHSSMSDMDIEYNLLKDSKNKKNAIKLSRGFLINAVQAIEFLNTQYDPLGMDLDGFSEIISLSVSDYDDVLEELYEKYKVYGRKIEPEIKLILMIGASATSFHASKKIINRVPGLNVEQHLKKNPSFINSIGKTIIKDNIPDTNSEFEHDKNIKMKSRSFMNKVHK
jgi:hypothetical protein